VFGPSVGKKCILFIDDLSMPLPEKYGAQPPIELLRQWIDHNHWYDLQTMSRIDILDMVSQFINFLLSQYSILICNCFLLLSDIYWRASTSRRRFK